MAFNADLADRILAIIGGHPALSERRMFGGIAFMLQGNMSVGVSGDDLLIRVSRDDWPALLALPHAREMDFTGRSMRGWLFIGPGGTATDDALDEWVGRAVSYALSLPAK